MRTITPLSLKMLQVRTKRMCMRISFSFSVSRTVRAIRALFIHYQNTAETNQPPAQSAEDWRAIDRAFPRGLQRLGEKIGSAWLLRKKKKVNFVDSRKLLLRDYKFEETKHDRFGKKPEATEAVEINDRSTEAGVNALRRLIELFFFFFFHSSTIV